MDCGVEKEIGTEPSANDSVDELELRGELRLGNFRRLFVKLLRYIVDLKVVDHLRDAGHQLLLLHFYELLVFRGEISRVVLLVVYDVLFDVG